MPSVTNCNARRRWMRIAAAGAAALVVAGGLAGCKSTTAAGTVGVERKQTLLLSSREVNNAAAQSYGQILAQAQSKGLLNRNPQQVARVRAVADRLIPATAAFRQDAPDGSGR